MSVELKLARIVQDDRKMLIADMKKIVKVKKNGKYTSTICKWLLRVVDGNIALPMGYVSKNKTLYDNTQEYTTDTLEKQTIFDNIGLRQEQIMFLNSVLVDNPKRFVVQAWDLKPGFGKTITCIAAIKFYNLDTVIVVHRKQLKSQWEINLKKFGVENTIVVMISQLEKITCRGMMVIDETHACTTTKGISLISKSRPKVLLGLSGTFYRYDELGVFLDWMYGDPKCLDSDAKIVLDNSTSRTIWLRVIETKVKPEIRTNMAGGLDWNCILQSLALDEKRNDIICKLVDEYFDKNILILVKFVEHGKLLAQLLTSSGHEVVTCFASDNLSDENIKCRVIISTSQKMGTGISINKLDCLILAADLVNYYIQYVSRVLREKCQDALVIDLIDDNPVLKRHFLERQKVYNELGAIKIQKYLQSE